MRQKNGCIGLRSYTMRETLCYLKVEHEELEVESITNDVINHAYIMKPPLTQTDWVWRASRLVNKWKFKKSRLPGKGMETLSFSYISPYVFLPSDFFCVICFYSKPML